jgi:hypothetical protein
VVQARGPRTVNLDRLSLKSAIGSRRWDAKAASHLDGPTAEKQPRRLHHKKEEARRLLYMVAFHRVLEGRGPAN